MVNGDPIAARYARDAPDFHANEGETSILLHVDPELVSLDRAAEAGAELFGALVDALADLLAAARGESDPDL